LRESARPLRAGPQCVEAFARHAPVDGISTSGGRSMIDWFESSLLGAATILLACGFLHRLRQYRSLLWGTSILLLLTALFPRPGNAFGQVLFGGVSGATRVPSEVFGAAWWVLGAWLVKSLLDLILRRTIFPNDNQPHARRLFADLASALIYVVAFVGIMETVLKQPLSAVVATSGVFAIVLGLALQNTLADMFSGLAINIERPFGAGDWITMNDGIEGQIIEIDWRATRIRSWSNDMIVIPNSLVAKGVVTSHHRHHDPYLCRIRVTVDGGVPPARVLAALRMAAAQVAGAVRGAVPTARACGFEDALIAYEVALPIDSFAHKPAIQSDLVERIAMAFHNDMITIGSAATEVHLLRSRAVEAVAVSGGAAHPA
jgi:small-conductance mechanosensitive channel